MVRLWWSQWVQTPPQWWFWAADHPRHPMGLRHHSPTPQGADVVTVPSSDRHHDGGGSVVAVGDGLVAWRRRRRLCRGGGGGTRLVEMEVMVASNEDDSKGSGGGGVRRIIEEARERSETAGGMAEARLCGGCDEVGR
ncbi:hypothetical protein Tco_0094032 [Tanacetum coccineum]